MVIIYVSIALQWHKKLKKKKKEGEIERAIYRPINGIVNCKKSTTSVKVNIPDGVV